jgi:hypothetical protein
MANSLVEAALAIHIGRRALVWRVGAGLFAVILAGLTLVS